MVPRPLVATPAPVDARWGYSLGDMFIAWTEAHLYIPRGPLRGQPLRWRPWQKEWWRECYRCDADGGLYYRLTILGVPKGNTKSGMGAADALWGMFGDPYEADPWVVVGATADKQADIIFGDTMTMAEVSPSLNEVSIRHKWQMRAKGGPGRIERVAASKGKLDGKDPSLEELDEVHEMDRENWTILSNGIAKRQRAAVRGWTTAGFDEESVLFELYTLALRSMNGEADNARFLLWWYGAPEGADHRDPKVWAAANPMFGLTMTEDTIRHELSTKPESYFRRYFLNQWTKAEDAWLPQGAWERCRVEPFELEAGGETWMGWDASTKRDSTGLLLGQKRVCEAGGAHVRIKGEAWERPLMPDGSGDPDWRVPVGDVKERVRQLCETYEMRAIPYDPAFVTWAADDLEDQGLPMDEWPQSPQRMVPATARLYELVMVACEGCGKPRLEHDGDPVLARHVGNVAARAMPGGGERLVKSARGKVIDLAIALAMMIGAMTKDEEGDGIVMYVPAKREKKEEE